MQFIVQIASRKFILDAARVDTLINALDGAQQIETKWVGKGGANANDNGYVSLLSSAPISDVLNFAPLTEGEYNALKLITASQQSA